METIQNDAKFSAMTLLYLVGIGVLMPALILYFFGRSLQCLLIALQGRFTESRPHSNQQVLG